MYKVLVVEDDPMVAMINMEYLGSVKNVSIAGHTKSQNETLEFLKKNEVDLILLDIFLGGENGLDILKEIREQGFTIDVIMITSANGREEISKALSLGSVDYLIKPFDLGRFKIAIGKFLKKNKLLSHETFTQEDFDSLLENKTDDFSVLPKGLNKKTLESVEKVISSIDKKFTIKDICEVTEVSNVTVKKYLDYLEGNGKIIGYVNYGNVGRPLYFYKKK